MSTHLYLALAPCPPAVDPNATDRATLARHQAALDRLSAAMEAVPLSAFHSYDLDTLAEVADEEMIAGLRSGGYRPTWFDPAAGLASVRALL